MNVFDYTAAIDYTNNNKTNRYESEQNALKSNYIQMKMIIVVQKKKKPK